MMKKIIDNEQAERAMLKRRLKRGHAILEMDVELSKPNDPGAGYASARVTGTLTVAGQIFNADDGHHLGLIAYVCGVRKVTVFTRSVPAGFTFFAIYDSPFFRKFSCGAGDEGLYFTRFRSALGASTKSKKQSKGMLDWWEKEKLPAAVSAVPIEFQVNTKFERGTYDEKGYVMTAKEIMARADWERMSLNPRSVLRVLEAPPEAPDAPLLRIGNVVYLQRSYAAGN